MTQKQRSLEYFTGLSPILMYHACNILERVLASLHLRHKQGELDFPKAEGPTKDVKLQQLYASTTIKKMLIDCNYFIQ